MNIWSNYIHIFVQLLWLYYRFLFSMHPLCSPRIETLFLKYPETLFGAPYYHFFASIADIMLYAKGYYYRSRHSWHSHKLQILYHDCAEFSIFLIIMIRADAADYCSIYFFLQKIKTDDKNIKWKLFNKGKALCMKRGSEYWKIEMLTDWFSAETHRKYWKQYQLD